MKKGFFYTMTMVLLFTVICGTVMTVRSQSRSNVAIDEKYYVSMEADYLDQVRTILTAHGLNNSGITMTKQYETDGSRNYSVLIHHAEIGRMSIADRQELKEALQQISFPAQNCHFTDHFLVSES